jgi:GTP-binding protein
MVVHGTMKIVSANLHDQAFSPDQIPSLEQPQVAVVGRSNVGKSSLLAAMMHRRKLVKVSSTPGKTRGIFFYIVNSCYYLVDLPGYGFSKAPRALTGKWHSLVEAYLDSRPGPSLALHLIDIRHPPTKDDLTVKQILAERKIPVVVVATKADKLSRSRRVDSLKVISRCMGVPVRSVIPVSVKDASVPVGSVWEVILPLLQNGTKSRSSS